MSQPVDNVLKEYERCMKILPISISVNKLKLKMQGMIEILEDFADYIHYNEFMQDKYEEIQSDLTKLKEGLR